MYYENIFEEQTNLSTLWQSKLSAFPGLIWVAVRAVVLEKALNSDASDLYAKV